MDAQNNVILAAEREKDSPYYREFLKTLADFKTGLGNRDVDAIQTRKLCLSTTAFDPETYAQGAAETTVVRYFLRRFPDSFEYEPRLNSPGNNKNVECSVRTNGLRLNIEVKVARHDKKIADDSYPGIKIESYGHFEMFPEMAADLLPLLGPELKDCHRPRLRSDLRTIYMTILKWPIKSLPSTIRELTATSSSLAAVVLTMHKHAMVT